MGMFMYENSVKRKQKVKFEPKFTYRIKWYKYIWNSINEIQIIDSV